MATNIKFGTTDKLTIVAGGTYTSGTPVMIGNALVVPLSDAVSGDKVEVQVRGRAQLNKTTGEAWALGAALYWVAGTSKLSTTASTNKAVGQAGEAAGSSDTEGWIDLGVGIEADSDVNTLHALLNSTAGAGEVGILDAAGDYTATDTEGALAEVKVIADANAVVASTAVTEASAAAAATQVLVSAGADRTAAASDVRIVDAQTGVQGAELRIYDAQGNYTGFYVEDALGSDESLSLDNMILAKSKLITVLAAASSGSSSADPDLVGGNVLGSSPLSGNDQVIESVAIDGSGVVTVTLAAASTAQSTFSVLCDLG